MHNNNNNQIMVDLERNVIFVKDDSYINNR